MMKEYTPKELEIVNGDLYEGVLNGFQKAVPTFIENVSTILGNAGGILTHGSFFRMTDDDGIVVYIQAVGAFTRKEDEVYMAMVQIFTYDDADEYNAARAEMVANSKKEFGDLIYGVPSTTEMGGIEIWNSEEE